MLRKSSTPLNGWRRPSACSSTTTQPSQTPSPEPTVTEEPGPSAKPSQATPSSPAASSKRACASSYATTACRGPASTSASMPRPPRSRGRLLLPDASPGRGDRRLGHPPHPPRLRVRPRQGRRADRRRLPSRPFHLAPAALRPADRRGTPHSDPALHRPQRLAELRELGLVDRVAVLGPRIAPRAHVVGVRRDAGDHLVLQRRVALDEARAQALANAQEVVEDEHLAVGGRAGTDADDRDLDAGHELGRDGRRDGLEDEAEAPRLLQRERLVRDA